MGSPRRLYWPITTLRDRASARVAFAPGIQHAPLVISRGFQTKPKQAITIVQESRFGRSLSD